MLKLGLLFGVEMQVEAVRGEVTGSETAMVGWCRLNVLE